jgi:hypothetical protein
VSVFSNRAGRSPEQAVAYARAVLALLGDRDPLAVLDGLMPALRGLVADLSEADLRRPEAPGKWSIAQVVDHLADEELVDAYRYRSVVAEDEPPLRGWDQDRWMARLRTGAADLDTMLAELAALRGRNLRLLRTLTPAELQRVGRHVERGPESVALIMRLHAGHDLVHRRQIARIRASFGKLPPDNSG